jgi:hypothetical protein
MGVVIGDRERAYLSLNHLDSIARQLEHVEQNGSYARSVSGKVKRAKGLVREAVTAAYSELERIGRAATGDSGNG